MEEALKITENPLVDNVGEEDVMPFEIKGGGGDGESIPKNDAAKETAAKGTLAKKMQNSPRNRNRKPVLLLIYFCGLGIVAFGVYSVALNDAEEVSNDTKSVNKFSIGLTRAFFDEACLIDMRNSTKKTSNNDDDDDPLRIVNDYMGPFIESLSIVNVLKSCVQLLIHFALQQAGGVPNPNQEVRGYKWVGKFLWALWVAFLIGSVASTITSLVVSFLSYGSLEMQYRKCMTEMESGDAFLNVVAPVFPLLPPFSGKIAGIAGGIFVLLQGIGVLTSLTPAQVGSWEVRLLAPLVGPLGIISVGYFYVTLSWIFSGLLFWPIPLVLCFVCICAWKAMIVTMAWLKDQSKYVENEAAERKKAAAAAATAATIEGEGGGDDQEQGAVSQAVTAVEHEVAEAVKQKVEPCSFVLCHSIDGYLVFWADSFAQTSLWWVQSVEDGSDDEPKGILKFVFLAGKVTLWPSTLVYCGFACADFDVDNPMEQVNRRIFRFLNTLAKSNTMTCLAFCGIAALCMGPFVTLSTWAAFAAYAGSTAADWGAFVGECYAAAFDFGGIGLPAFSFDFSALADLDVTFNSIIPEFDVVSPAEVLRAAKALDAASVVFSICKVLVTLGSWILSLQDAFGDNLVVSDLAAGQADIGHLVRAHATWPELQTAINRAFSEELVSLATGDDEGFFEFVLTKDKDYPGNLNATDFGQYPLDLIVVLKLYEELEGDIGDLLPGCINLRVFVVTGNKKLTGDIQALENCPNMTETDFSDCSNIEGGCCSLEELKECSSLSFLRPSPDPLLEFSRGFSCSELFAL